MCRNIKTLYNFEPLVTNEEINAASLQFVRKVSGFAKPSKVNEEAFNNAVIEVSKATQKLMHSLMTTAHPKNREVETEHAHARAMQRFGKN